MFHHHFPHLQGPFGEFTQQTKPNGSEFSGKAGKQNRKG
jgi:hypothetical protein